MRAPPPVPIARILRENYIYVHATRRVKRLYTLIEYFICNILYTLYLHTHMLPYK